MIDDVHLPHDSRVLDVGVITDAPTLVKLPSKLAIHIVLTNVVGSVTSEEELRIASHDSAKMSPNTLYIGKVDICDGRANPVLYTTNEFGDEVVVGDGATGDVQSFIDNFLSINTVFDENIPGYSPKLMYLVSEHNSKKEILEDLYQVLNSTTNIKTADILEDIKVNGSTYNMMSFTTANRVYTTYKHKDKDNLTCYDDIRSMFSLMWKEILSIRMALDTSMDAVVQNMATIFGDNGLLYKSLVASDLKEVINSIRLKSITDFLGSNIDNFETTYSTNTIDLTEVVNSEFTEIIQNIPSVDFSGVLKSYISTPEGDRNHILIELTSLYANGKPVYYDARSSSSSESSVLIRKEIDGEAIQEVVPSVWIRGGSMLYIASTFGTTVIPTGNTTIYGIDGIDGSDFSYAGTGGGTDVHASLDCAGGNRDGVFLIAGLATDSAEGFTDLNKRTTYKFSISSK